MVSFERSLQLSLPQGQSAFLWGARKTGKTTYLRHRFPDSAFFDLLDSDLFLGFSKRPALFREQVLALPSDQLHLPIVVDEIQKVPSLLDEVHLLSESHGLGFVLCGSSARKVRRGQANLLGGRAWRYEMLPLTVPEIPDFDLLTALQRGLIPSHYLSPDPDRSLRVYVSDYLKEEIREEGLTRNLPAFGRFLDAAGFSQGELVNLAGISRDAGVSAKTVREYFQILEDTLLGIMVQPYRRTRSRQIIGATPKFYFFDLGVANSLAGRTIVDLTGEAAGRAFEHFILMALVAWRAYREQDFTIRFWRTKTGLEVDFVLTSRQGARLGIEVKNTDRVDRTDLRGLKALAEETSIDRLQVVCRERAPRLVPVSPELSVRIQPWERFQEDLWGGKLFDQQLGVP